jgi:hydroxyatrazine ethylaminohydrolase
MEAAAISASATTRAAASTRCPREGSTMPDDMVENHVILKDCERLIDLYHDPSPLQCADRAGPCQPINSYKETFIETVRMAREKGVRCTPIWARGRTPSCWRRTGIARGVVPGDRLYRPGRLVDTLGAAAGGSSVLAAAGSGVSHCPARRAGRLPDPRHRAMLGGGRPSETRWTVPPPTIVQSPRFTAHGLPMKAITQSAGRFDSG